MTVDSFERHLTEVPPHRTIVRAIEAELMGGLTLQPPILDVGCGDGHFADVAYDDIIDIGADLPGSGLAAAAARGAYRWVIPASGADMPFADGSFRTVISNSVLEHIPRLDATLREISRVLAPGGRLAFTTPSQYFGDFLFGNALMRRLGLPALGRAYADWFDGISYHYHRLAPDGWRAKLSAVGLEVKHYHYYFPEEAHHVFDVSHYLGAPSLVSHHLTGRWLPHPALYRPLARLLRRYTNGGGTPIEAGAYLFFICEKPQDVDAT